LTRGCIERTERLVEQQDARLARQRSRQRHALTLTTRQRARACRGSRGRPNALEQRRGLAAASGAITRAHTEHDIVERRKVVEQRRVLKHHTDAPVLRSHVHGCGTVAHRVGEHRVATANTAPHRSNGARYCGECEALARPRRPHQRRATGSSSEAGINGEVAHLDAHVN